MLEWRALARHFCESLERIFQWIMISDTHLQRVKSSPRRFATSLLTTGASRSKRSRCRHLRISQTRHFSGSQKNAMPDFDRWRSDGCGSFSGVVRGSTEGDGLNVPHGLSAATTLSHLSEAATDVASAAIYLGD